MRFDQCHDQRRASFIREVRWLHTKGTHAPSTRDAYFEVFALLEDVDEDWHTVPNKHDVSNVVSNAHGVPNSMVGHHELEALCRCDLLNSL
jgi:hypothetical protein